MLPLHGFEGPLISISPASSSTNLRTVLSKIAEHPISRINEILPGNLALALMTQSSLAA